MHFSYMQFFPFHFSRLFPFYFPLCFPVVGPRYVTPGGWVEVLEPGPKSSSQGRSPRAEPFHYFFHCFCNVFHQFSLFFIVFAVFFINFHWFFIVFAMFFISFHYFSLFLHCFSSIVIGFSLFLQCFSSVFIIFHCFCSVFHQFSLFLQCFSSVFIIFHCFCSVFHQFSLVFMSTHAQFPCFSLMWVLVASGISLVLKWLVLLAFCFMSENDILCVCARGQASCNHDTISDWSVVSDPDSSPRHTTDTCRHLRLTRRGTNHLKIQVKCKDCKHVLMEKPTPLGIKLKAQKAKVRQGKASLEEE